MRNVLESESYVPNIGQYWMGKKPLHDSENNHVRWMVNPLKESLSRVSIILKTFMQNWFTHNYTQYHMAVKLVWLVDIGYSHYKQQLSACSYILDIWHSHIMNVYTIYIDMGYWAFTLCLYSEYRCCFWDIGLWSMNIPKNNTSRMKVTWFHQYRLVHR